MREEICQDYDKPPDFQKSSDGFSFGCNLKVGSGTKIFPFTTIGDNVEIGENCLIESGVTIGSGARICDNCVIHSGSRVGVASFFHCDDNRIAKTSLIYGCFDFWNDRILQVVKKLQISKNSSENISENVPEKLSGTMKLSKFNYFQRLKSGRGYMVFNTLYNSLVRLTNLEYEKLFGRKSSGKNLERKFVTNGFIIPIEIDELETCQRWIRMQWNFPKPYLSINLTTTLKCNARCYYCYEKGVKHQDFMPPKMPKLLEFIRNHIHENDLLMLNWLGGEPLMNWGIFDFLTDSLNELKIKFSSYIITNGSLITKHMVEKDFARWNVKDVQITLDGIA